MKKLTILAVAFALFACLLTACRSRGNDTMTTTGDPHTLPETTGATITMPTEGTTRQTQPMTPSTDGNDTTGTTNGTDSNGGANNGSGSNNGGGSDSSNGTNTPGRDRGITRTPGRY